MNQIKDHLDKIVAGVIIVACLGLVAKTHLSEHRQAVSIKEIDEALDRVGNPGQKVEVAPIPKFGTEFEASMARLDGNLPDGLSSWRFYVKQDRGKKPEKNWTLVAKVFAAAQRAAADAEARTLKGKIVAGGVEVVGGVFVHEPEPKGSGFWLCAGRFTSPTDRGVEPTREMLLGAGYTNPLLKNLKSSSITPIKKREGVLALPEMKVKGVYMGKAELAALFNVKDANSSVKLLQVWRRKAGDKKWPAAPHFTLTLEGDKTTMVPAEGASGDKSGLSITELKLPPREAYEYRARAAASFPKKVELAKDLGLESAPKELATLLKGPGYVTKFTAPVKIETPGEVQIQFAGELMMRRRRYGNFRLKRWMAGSSKPVIYMMRFLLGKRIKTSTVKRIGGKPVKVLFDSEAILVSMATETRQVWGTKRVMVKDPETGVLVPKWVKYRKPDKKVKVAVIKDVRTGKTHKLDQSSRDKGWWPKGLAVQAAPAPTPATPATPVVGSTPRRGPVNGTSPRRGPVVAPKTPVTPKGTTPVEAPKKQPVTPSKPPAVGTKPPPPPPPPPPGTAAEGRDPGPRPTSGTLEALKAWEKKRAEYQEWLKRKRASESK